MALSNIVDGNITIVPGAAEPSPLDLELLGVTLTAPQDALWGPNLVREVAADTWVDVMAEVGITDGEAVYEYLQATFGQATTPRLVLLGKRATPVAQVTRFDLGVPGAATDGLYRLTIGTTNFDVNAVAQTRAQVVTAMIALIPGVSGEPVSAAPGVTAEDIDVSATSAGTPFVFAASAPAPDAWVVTPQAANVGFTTDQVAWNDERPDFYLVTRVEAWGFDEAKAWAESLASFPRDITGWARTDTATDPNAATADPTRVAARLAAFSFGRLVVTHVPLATDVDWATIIAWRIGTVPGSTTWALQLLSGIDGELWNSGQGANLISGPYAYFDRIDSAGGALSQNVRVVSGTPYDIVRGIDYVKASIDAAVVTLLIRADKVQQTADGYAEIGSAMANVLDGFVKTSFIAPTRPDGSPGYTVTIPPVPPPGSPDRLARIARDFKFEFLAAGAVEHVDYLGEVQL